MSYSVEITVGTTKYVYPGGPTLASYYVIFRPNGFITFHLGAFGPLPDEFNVKIHPASFNLKLHHVKITDTSTNTVAFDQDIQDHYWQSQWTYRPNPIAILRTPKEIVDTNRMFAFGRPPQMAPLAPALPRGGYSIMGCANNMTVYMPTTGERSDIGLVTDHGAQAMMGISTANLIDWAQSAASYSLHYRDENTGKPLNILLNKCNRYALKQRQPGLWIDQGPVIPATGTVYLPDGTLDPNAPGYDRGSDGWITQGGGKLTAQMAHFTEMSYLAHQFTKDPVFLEDCQHEANFVAIGDDGRWDAQNRPIFTSEYRGEGWAIRSVMMAHVVTKDAEDAGTLPSTCLPSSYFKTILDAQLEYRLALCKLSVDPQTGRLKSSDPSIECFRLLNAAGRFGPWQHDYVMLALSFAVLTGHDDWKPLYLWALGNTVARTNSTATTHSGYPTGYGGAYYVNTVRGQGSGWDAARGPQPSDWGKRYTTWAECFEDLQLYGSDPWEGTPSGLTQAQYDFLLANPLNNGTFITGFEYCQNTHAILVAAAYLEFKGLINVRTAYPELDRCIANVERALTGSHFGPRQSIVNDPAAAPVVITPLPPGPSLPGAPPVTPPPETGAQFPVPNLDPASFAFELPAAFNGVTDLDNVYVDLSGKVAVDTNGTKVVCNIKGNGKTNVWIKWDAYADWMHLYPDTPAGAKDWVENHGSGWRIRLYNCGGFVYNTVVMTPLVTVDPTPIPDPTPQPTGITMPTTSAIKIGQSQQLDLTVSPVGADISSLTYHAVPSDVVSLAPNSTGVKIIGLKAGLAKVYADVNGADANNNPAVVEAECDVTVSPILATSLTLTPVGG